MRGAWQPTMHGEDLSHYYDQRFERDVVKIKPGQFFATTRTCVISTVLGSCVAACIRDTTLASAGMNHFMLPKQVPRALADGQLASLCYGLYAMESLLNEFIKHGSKRENLEAKVFGGAAVVDAISNDIGAANARFVVDYLDFERIRTTAIDVGGTLPRKICYFVEDGRVFVKYLRRIKNDTIQRRELEYARELREQDAPPAELFLPSEYGSDSHDDFARR